MQQGIFITLEGVEGAGKSTLMAYVAEYYIEKSREVIQTREPGGTKAGEQIRAILLDSDNETLTDNTELLLMFAARMQHIDEIIKPALSSEKIVICDRFTDATYAYQGAGRGLDISRIEALENWVQQGLKPDITLLFDLDVETGLRRANQRSDADRFEQEEISFFERIRSCYLERADKDPNRFRIIDASQSFENVKKQIHTILEGYSC